MGTSGCIAVWEDKENEVIKGKSVNSDGYPDSLGVSLQNWVIKNGRDETIEILINSKEAQSGWSAISENGDTSAGWKDPNFANDSYYCRGDTSESYFYTVSKIGVTAYTYILKKNSIEVYFFDEPLGKVKYFDIKKMKNLEWKG